MSSILGDPEHADPENVKMIMLAMMQAIRENTDEDTSFADVLSAIFTVLDHTLSNVKEVQTPEEAEVNSAEVGRVLTDLLMEFGTIPPEKLN